MPRKLQTANARARHRRETLAIRRVGLGKKCACGESRPEAIIPGINGRLAPSAIVSSIGTPDRINITYLEKQTIPNFSIPVNDHRASSAMHSKNGRKRLCKTVTRVPCSPGCEHPRFYRFDSPPPPKNRCCLPRSPLKRLDTYLTIKYGKRYFEKVKAR